MNDRPNSHRAGHQVPAFAPAIGLREVLEASPDLVFCCDAWGRFAWVSSAFESIAGWRATELVGQPYTKLVPPAECAGVARASLRQRRRSVAVVARDLTLARSDGSSLPLSVRVRLYERPDGDAYYVGVARERVPVAVPPAAPALELVTLEHSMSAPTAADEAMALATAAVSDATEAATAAEERAKKLEAQLEQERASSQMKSEFLATLSQEVRTPMNGVVSLSHKLLQSGLDGAQRQMVDALLGSSQTLMALVNDANDYTRLEAGSMAVERIDFDLRVAMEQVATSLVPAAEARGLTFETHVEALVPSRLKGDPGRLRQVLLNLGQNAIRFTDEGRVLLHLEREREDDTHVTMLFRVESPGAPAEGPRRADGPEGDGSRRPGGSALALAISRRLVERMGGQVAGEDPFSPRQHVRFRLTLEKQSQAPAAHVPAEVQLRGLRVLVADGEAQRAPHDGRGAGRVGLRGRVGGKRHRGPADDPPGGRRGAARTPSRSWVCSSKDSTARRSARRSAPTPTSTRRCSCSPPASAGPAMRADEGDRLLRLPRQAARGVAALRRARRRSWRTATRSCRPPSARW